MHVLDEEELVASAVVFPGSTEEVQKIVLWANEYKIPVFPISIGRNRRLSNSLKKKQDAAYFSCVISRIWWSRTSCKRIGGY